MFVMGVDPSSSCAGIVKIDILTALQDPFQALVWKGLWKPPARASRPDELLDYSDCLDEVLGDGPLPDVAVVLRLASMRGAKTVRTLSHFESATYIVLARRRVPILTVRDSDARHHVLGLKITASKEEAIKATVERFPGIKWSPFGEKFDGPGGDEIDAFIGALSAPAIMRGG
jgi:Holliday junction resolvasome RuvABC endonuclease subunit